jgi:diaminopimelate epimerase
MHLAFTKMHGLGNDFVVVDAIHQSFDPTPDQCRHLADRRLGIGCDQILLVQRPEAAGADFHYRIFNRDGSEVEQCGNGARCFARFVLDRGLTAKREIAVDTRAGRIRLFLEADGQVRVNMGTPRFDPAQIPFLAEQERERYTLNMEGEPLSIGAVSMGNPHAVLWVEEVDRAPVARLGPRIEHHPRFPNRVNAGFAQLVDRGHLRLRVHERGSGETLACGTGACAAAVVGQRQGLTGKQVRVSLPGGDLVIQWDGDGEPVWMTGPAVRVFDGEIEL